MTDLQNLFIESLRFQDRYPLFFYEDTTVRERGVRSLEAFLATEGAAELIFSFLDSDGDGENIVWLSNDSCLSNYDSLDEADLQDDDGQLVRLFRIYSYDPSRGHPTNTYFYKSRTAVESPITSVDTVFQLLAKHKSLTYVGLGNQGLPATEPFPVSNDALTTFVSHAQSPRTIDFWDLPLSIDQWRVIMTNCNEHVKLGFTGPDWSIKGPALIDAVRHNQCPTKLWLNGFNETPHPTLRELVAALEANTSLSDLEVSARQHRATEHLTLLFGAISRNRGLQKLGLGVHCRMSDQEWECLWSAVASHPTVKYINLHVYSFLSNSESERQRRAETMLQSVLSNTVLCELECDYQYLFHDRQTPALAIEEQIRPVLELNHFRLQVHAIKQEPNAHRRERLFAETLLGAQVLESSSACYLLLNENPDLLVQLSFEDARATMEE